MKRFAALLIALFLLPLTASAYNLPEPMAAEELPQSLTDFITVYNSYADNYAVPPLPFDGWRDRDVYYGLSIGESSYTVAIDGKHRLATIILPPDEVDMDFLAIFACMSAAVRGESLDNYADIMTAYFLFRNAAIGERITHKSPGGLIFFQRDEDLFLFGVSN